MCYFFMVVKWVYQKALFFVRIVARVGMFPNPIQYLKSKGQESCPCPQCGSYTLAYQEKMIKRLLLEKDDQKIVA